MQKLFVKLTSKFVLGEKSLLAVALLYLEILIAPFVDSKMFVSRSFSSKKSLHVCLNIFANWHSSIVFPGLHLAYHE